MASFTLIESTPSVPAGMSSRYFVVAPGETRGRTILIVAIEGEYPDGSRGNTHGAYIATAALHGLHAFDADCLILDLRGMTYRWGNTLLQVFQDIAQYKDSGAEADEPRFPVVVVTSERCRAPFLSLVTPAGQQPPEWHFEDMDAAIEYGLQKANEWLEY